MRIGQNKTMIYRKFLIFASTKSKSKVGVRRTIGEVNEIGLFDTCRRPCSFELKRVTQKKNPAAL